jgi:TPR repeat protein
MRTGQRGPSPLLSASPALAVALAAIALAIALTPAAAALAACLLLIPAASAMAAKGAGAKPSSKAVPKPASKAEAKPKAGAKPAAKAEAKPKAGAKPAAKAEAKPKAGAKPAAKAEAKPKAGAKPAAKAEAKPKAKPRIPLDEVFELEDELDEGLEEWNPTPEELEQEIADLTRQSEDGDPEAMISLANIRFWGVNEAGIDLEEAYRWYSEAARFELPEAICGMAMCILSRDSSSREESDEGLRLLRIAGERGDELACTMLAEFYGDKSFTYADPDEAAYWAAKVWPTT